MSPMRDLPATLLNWVLLLTGLVHLIGVTWDLVDKHHIVQIIHNICT